MIAPMTQEDADQMILEATARARQVPPRFEVKPAIDWERLGPLCTGPIPIETVRGRGYLFTAPRKS